MTLKRLGVATPFIALVSLSALAESPRARAQESTLSAKDVLDRSIRYHDPEGNWEGVAHRIALSESRPNGPDRETTVVVDQASGRFTMERNFDDGKTARVTVRNEKVEAVLDGSTAISPADAERYRLSPERVLFTRNYYLYLYGLPMKLRDPGTRLDPGAKETTFQSHDVYELRVTYEESVGSDTWYFYLDRRTFALVGCRFYHDESQNDGEYIVLEGEASGAGIRLPRTRKWYRHQDDGYLGTDTIRSITAVRAESS